ncbi:hypothetical protein [Amycolatopsis thermoflava]|uniref:hypothetical protein n=1 Tax=Amycolatopsis thermoflava TaxID=84480 RepID=UPI003F4A2A88
MNGARWWSQPFAPEGSAASDGIKKQLGTPKMDPLAVLVRESAQNSWDARRPGSDVEFTVSLSRPSRDRLRVWADQLLPEPEGPGAFGLLKQLTSEDTVLLRISDRGTTGLGGPLRADRAAEETPDFVNLVRNIGEPRDKDFGGGTYGFGKGVLFTSSEVGAVLIRTRCVWEGRPQTRLIGVAMANTYEYRGRRYTGRHWWGNVNDDVPDPLLDDDAQTVADKLGLPPLNGDDFGTDIIIIGARLGSALDESSQDVERPRSLNEAAQYVASAMVWHLWPLLLPGDDGKVPLRCRVLADQQEVSVPHPSRVVRLRPFVDAYKEILAGQGRPVQRQRPQTGLGTFAARYHMAPIRREPIDVAAPFEGNGHHCVLLREPRLVVRYLPGPVALDEMMHYGAVFLANRELDPIFASAEPPTHDDWVSDSLSGRNAMLLVRFTIRKLEELLQEAAGLDGKTTVRGGSQPPLGALSSKLGALIPTATGSGADGQRASGGGGGGTGGVGGRQARIIDGPKLVRDGEDARILATIEIAESRKTVHVKIRPLVALDSGSETDPPAGADSPEVLGLYNEERDVVRSGDLLAVKPDDPRRWVVVIRPAADAATRLRLEVEDGRRR